MRKRGRPKTGEPVRTKRVQVLLTEVEEKTISKAAKRAGKSLSAYLRDRGLEDGA